jgi:hypothetical protein
VAQGRAREFIMASNNTDIRFTRVHLIEIEIKIYVLMYVTDAADDVASPSASRFFTSFHAKQ